MKLTVSRSHIEKLLKHSIKSRSHDSWYGEKTGPGLFLVGDQGVYFMSTGSKQPRSIKDRVAYTREGDPDNHDWYDVKQTAFGGDDGVMFIPAKIVTGWLQRHYTKNFRNAKALKIISFNLTPSRATF